MHSIKIRLDDLVNELSVSSNKSFFLSVLRLYIAFHIFRNVIVHWGARELILGPDSIFPFYLTSPLIQFFQQHCQLFFFGILILSIFMFFGIGKHLTIILLTIAVGIYQEMIPYLLNGGDNYLKLILIYLIFANSFDYLSIKKLQIKNIEVRKLSNFLTNLMVYAILFHLCLIYFISGIEKLHSDSWYNGVALYYTLNLERFNGTPFNHLLSSNGWFVNMNTYLVMLFELYFPVLIWSKKWRIPLVVFGVSMHLGILIFMMLYDFQVLFIFVYGLWFTNQEWFLFLENVRRKIPYLKSNVFMPQHSTVP